MGAPRPWYFKNGAPINAEQIRKIVDRARELLRPAADISCSNERDYLPSEQVAGSSEIRRYVVRVARYFAKQIERDLVRLLLTELESLRRRDRNVASSGDPRLDATRAWRRQYQRRYRISERAKMEHSAHETK